MIELILEAVKYILPAYVANSSSVLFGGGSPIDLGRELHGNRLLGDGKTWRGLIFGLMSGSIAAVGIGIILGSVLISLYGVLISLGGLLGDIAASFFKRRIGVERGDPAPLLDQLDFVLGALALGSVLFVPSEKVILTIIILTPFLHLLANVIGYLLDFKDKPW